MNKSRFTAKSMSYEHSYEQYSFVYKSRRGEEVDGIYKYYICHYNFLHHPIVIPAFPCIAIALPAI